jgi:hypothetical protein
MIYSLTLENALLLVGCLLVFSHLPALLWPASVQQKLKALPRSAAAGVALLTVSALWFAALVAFTDLGDFTSMRNKFLLLTAAAYVLTLKFVGEFLAVRALGMVLLLAAEPLLEAAWMRPEMGRLWLVSLVYVWIVCALFFIGTPYVLRDAIGWVQKSGLRWRAAALAGIAYGALLLGVRATL